jgi:hypothetical protein
MRRVEIKIKGTKNATVSFRRLHDSQLDRARRDPRWRLWVVTEVMSQAKRRIHEFTLADVKERLKTSRGGKWQVRFRKSDFRGDFVLYP